MLPLAILFQAALLAASQTPLEYCDVLQQSSSCRFFAAVIDAGSTGTRLHLYTLRWRGEDGARGMPFVVDKETFKEVKPGLSAFSADPPAAARSVQQLIEHAYTVVPPHMRDRTPIALKATAGIRLLPGNLADVIMNEVASAIASSGFLGVENGVEIMSGADEGVFSWFTLNLLLETLFTESVDPSPDRSAAAFDLGGGSTQVTFWPVREKEEGVFSGELGSERVIDFFGSHMRLFTHSFLGNGLVASRLSVLELSSEEGEMAEGVLRSPCLPEGFSIDKWHYAMKEWRVEGCSAYSPSACSAAVSRFVDQSRVMRLDAIQHSPVYLFSYFFDRGLQAGLVSDSRGGATTVGAFRKAAEKACSADASSLEGPHWLPWKCLDLTYIHALLHDGYGFPDDMTIHLAKKMRGMEVSWAQGLAVSMASPSLGRVDETARNLTGRPLVDQLIGLIAHSTSHVLSYLNLISD